MNNLSYTEEDFRLRKRVVDVLRLAMDPEMGINIVDMGLIYSADIHEHRKEILVQMTLSSKGCPMGEAIAGGAENILRSHFSDYSIVVDVVWEPAWSYEFISAEGLQQLES